MTERAAVPPGSRCSPGDAGHSVAGALGLVYGRRRQGKTLLLELLALELGGFLFAATQQSETQNLADLGAAYAAYRGLRQPVVLGGYGGALDELLMLGEERATAVIVDEFPNARRSRPRSAGPAARWPTCSTACGMSG